MAQPVLVKAYTSRPPPSARRPIEPSDQHQLPPVSSYAFANILIAADSADFQKAIESIADICAKHKLSLADEYSVHLPPVGEIANAQNATPGAITLPVFPPAWSSTRRHPFHSGGGRRFVLASVPEASSGSSESSRRSHSSKLFGFRTHPMSQDDAMPVRRVCIGQMGRTVAMGSTTALATEVGSNFSGLNPARDEVTSTSAALGTTTHRSEAQLSLQRILSMTVPG